MNTYFIWEGAILSGLGAWGLLVLTRLERRINEALGSISTAAGMPSAERELGLAPSPRGGLSVAGSLTF